MKVKTLDHARVLGPDDSVTITLVLEVEPLDFPVLFRGIRWEPIVEPIEEGR